MTHMIIINYIVFGSLYRFTIKNPVSQMRNVRRQSEDSLMLSQFLTPMRNQAAPLF